MAFKRKAKSTITKVTPAITSVKPNEPESRKKKSHVGFLKSLLTPLNVGILIMFLLNLALSGGRDNDSKTNLRDGAKTPDAKAAETPITGKLLDSDAIESVLNSGRENIALKKPAAQASDYNAKTWGRNAVDGKRSGDIVSHTKNENCNDWWQVDLQGIYSVEDIIVFNRGGAQMIVDRLSNFFVEVLTLNGESWDITGKYHSTQSAGARAGYHFEPGAEGSVVRIRLGECEVLHMEQVEVYGIPVVNF